MDLGCKLALHGCGGDDPDVADEGADAPVQSLISILIIRLNQRALEFSLCYFLSRKANHFQSDDAN